MTITLTHEEAQQVLDALQCATPPTFSSKLVEEWHKAGDVLRAKLSESDVMINGLTEQETAETMSVKGLSEPEPEPVAWIWDVYNGAGYSSRGIGFQQTDIPFARHTPLYTAPPQREWVGLTKEELEFYTEELGQGELGRGVLRAVVDFLKEKNNG